MEFNKTATPDGLVVVDKVMKVQLAWNYAALAESHKLYRDGVLIAENLTENTFTDESVEEGKTYCYKVTAVKEGTESEPTNEVCVTVTGEVLPCSAPTAFNGTMQSGIVHLEWTAPADRVPDGYALVITDTQSGAVVVTENLAETSFDFGPMTEAFDYKFQVKAVYAECESEFALTATGEDFLRYFNTSVADLTINCQIYPNPTNGSVMIEAKDMKSVTVTNLVGQQVYAIACEDDALNLDLSQQQSGIYFVKIVTAYGETTKRVSVMK